MKNKLEKKLVNKLVVNKLDKKWKIGTIEKHNGDFIVTSFDEKREFKVKKLSKSILFSEKTWVETEGESKALKLQQRCKFTLSKGLKYTSIDNLKLI